MHTFTKLFWTISFVLLMLAFLLTYTYLDLSVALFGFDIQLTKSEFFYLFMVIIIVSFFKLKFIQRGIRRNNWAFLFPLSHKWRNTAENRDLYSISVESWILGLFSFFNLIFASFILSTWAMNESTIYAFKMPFTILLVVSLVGLVLTLIIPPFNIKRGPKN